MQKLNLYIVGILLMAIIGFNSCTKNNGGIDNNQIIETPYSLFFSDSAGAVYNSNDGKAYTNIFPADGRPCRAICSQESNIFIVKTNLYTSFNNGLNFSVGNNEVDSLTTTDCNNITVGLNESMIINIPNWYRTYIASNNPAPQNYFGQEFSFSGGGYGTWANFDATFDTFPGHIGNLGFQMISYTQLSNGILCALGIQPPVSSPYNYRNFYKVDTETYATPWEEVTGDILGAPRNQTGSPLPTNGFFTLGHYNERLIAIDSKCNNGAYYSDDTGRTWIQYPGIPPNTSLLSICSPFEETCLIGSAAGLYVLNNNTGTFQLNTNGLTADLRVSGITYKENVYKTGTSQKFVYLATNKGIYQSTDGGNNFILTIPGNYTCIY